MRMLRTFLPLLALPLLGALPAPGQAGAPRAAAQAPAALLPYETLPPAATHPSLYSFADTYRLAVSGQALDGLRVSGAEALDALRLSGAETAHWRAVSRRGADAAPEVRFSVSAPRDAGHWPLVLAGLFACAWVAHRRLTSPY